MSKSLLKRLEGSKIMEYAKKGKLELRTLDKFELPMLICDDEVFFALEDMAARYFNYETQVWIKDFRVRDLFEAKFNEYWEKAEKV